MDGRGDFAGCNAFKVDHSSLQATCAGVRNPRLCAEHLHTFQSSTAAILRLFGDRFHRLAIVNAILCVLVTGCYAPLHSDGIEARKLSDEFRWPQRTSSAHLNYSSLVGPTPIVYLLGPGDRLEVTVPDLVANGNVQSFQVTVLDQGEIHLPRMGPVMVGGLSLAQAQQQINSSLAGTLLQNPGAMVSLVEKGTVNVLVLGAVKQPGVHALPRYENDVAHAIAAAQGFTDDSGDFIEVHRREQFVTSSMELRQSDIQKMSYQLTAGSPMTGQAASGNSIAWPQPVASPIDGTSRVDSQFCRYGGHSLGQQQLSAQNSHGKGGIPVENTAMLPIIRIPLRGINFLTNPADVVLHASDVVVVPRGADKVFYVVGPLSEQSRIRFSVGDRDREIGSGLLLPDDREVDVVTAVAMAGYIDPIESPTTVSVHRTGPNGMPILIKVDLIAARTDPQETVLVQAGDIIYLNPDPWWYYRRTMDRIIDQALGTATGRWLTN